MDSIYEQPRNVPRPNFYDNRFTRPSVPEVSLLLQDKVSVDHGTENPNTKISPNDYMSYNAWKVRNNVQQKEGLTEKQNDNNNLEFNPQLFSRKQVRFEGQSRQNISPAKNLNNVQVHTLPNLKNGLPSSTLISKPFEEIYMQNIPNRHLDLSIIDVQPKEIPKIKNSIISKNILQEQSNKMPYNDNNIPIIMQNHNERVIPMKEYGKFCNDKMLQNRNSNKPLQFANRNCNYTNENNLDKQCVETKQRVDNDEMTTKDLLKIIQQQNEQILILQKQVASLLNIQEQKQIEPPPNNPPAIYGMSNKQFDTIPVFARTPDKNKPTTNPKFAIDVMTSFEVSIRPPQNYLHKYNNNNNDCLFGKPKICEIVEVDNSNEQHNSSNNTDTIENIIDKTDCSLLIKDDIHIPEEIPSPENSIHVDMQDYSSDSDDEFVTTDLGWTIYKNIMGQVNNVLQQKQRRKPRGTSSGSENSSNSGKINEKTTMKKVREATIKHLKQIGIDVNRIPSDCESTSAIDCSSNNLKDQEFSPNEISFAVKQLLMKYLPNDELLKVMDNRRPIQKAVRRKNDRLMCDGKRKPDLSFATMQYMKKYNLLEKNVSNSPKKRLDDKSPKFLDITALKQQPKLL